MNDDQQPTTPADVLRLIYVLDPISAIKVKGIMGQIIANLQSKPTNLQEAVDRSGSAL